MVAVAVVFHRIVFLDETWVLGDALIFTLPSREAVAAAIRAGRLPEWWDAVGTGASLAGNPIHAALSPVAWLLFPIPRIGPDLYTLLHLAVGGAGVGLWAARLGADERGTALSAAIFTASGYVVSTVPNGMAPVLAFTPWIAWAADRLAGAKDRRARLRAALVLATAWALQLLPGEPGQIIAAGWVMIAVLLGRGGLRCWRLLGWAAGSVAAAFVLDAMTIIPAVAQLRISVRSAGLPLAEGGFWSMHPARLIELVWPRGLGPPLQPGRAIHALLRQDTPGTESLGPVWAHSVYLGAVPLALASVASDGRTRRALVIASAGFVVLAFGTWTPLYAVYRWAFLPEQIMRYPEKHIAGAIAIWCALAGVGLTRVLRGAAPKRLAPATAIAAAGSAILCLSLFAARESVGASLAAGVRRLDGPAAIRAIAGGGMVLAASLAALSSAVVLARRGRVRGAAAVAAAAALGPLVWNAIDVTPTATRGRVLARPAVLERILEADPDARLGPAGVRIARGFEPVDISWDRGEMVAAYSMETIAGNTASRFGFGVVPGFDSAPTARAERFGAAVERLDGWSQAALVGIPWALERIGPGEKLPRPAFLTLGKGWHLLRIPEARPRAFVAPRWTTALPGDAAIEAFARPERAQDLGRVAVEGAPPSPPGHDGEPLSPCLVAASAPEDVELLCTSRLGGFAVLLDQFVPGWTATVDGEPVQIRMVDGIFRGVPIGPGPHRVHFQYETPGLRGGIVVSLAGCLVFAIVVFVTRRRKSDPA